MFDDGDFTCTLVGSLWNTAGRYPPEHLACASLCCFVFFFFLSFLLPDSWAFPQQPVWFCLGYITSCTIRFAQFFAGSKKQNIYSGFSRNSDHRSKRWDGGQETKRRKTGFSNLSLGSYAQSSQRDGNSHTSCCLFMKHPPGEIISLWELISFFLSRNTKNQGGSGRLFRGPRKIY